MYMDELKIRGLYRFKKYKPFENDADYNDPAKMAARQPIWTGDWIDNLVMISPNRGLGIIAARMAGTLTNDVEITTASIGKGVSPPQITDTGLEDPILEGITRTSQSNTADSVLVGFFIPSIDLPNDTYTEFGVFCGTQIFARSIIDPAFTKSTNEDVGIEYSFLLGNFAPIGS